MAAAAMAVGVVYGTTKPTGTAPRQAYARTKAMLDRFRSRFGTTQCGDLTRRWSWNFASRDRVYRCAELVRFTLEEIDDVLHCFEELPEWQEPWWDNYLTQRDKVT